MKVCNDGHKEIVYDDSEFRSVCPMCEATEKIAELEQAYTELTSELEDMAEELRAAQEASNG